MKRKIALKIDVTKIDKARLYKGEKGTYLDCIYHYNDIADQYGNHGFISESVSKEEREAGTQGTILGNGKIVWTESLEPQKGVTTAQVADKFDGVPEQDDDDLPFAAHIY